MVKLSHIWFFFNKCNKDLMFNMYSQNILSENRTYNKVLVVSNMYPNNQYPSYGVFVKHFCDQLNEIGIDFSISVLNKTQNRTIKIVKYGLFYLRTFFMVLFGNYDLVYIHYPSFSAKPVLIAHKFKSFDIISNVHGTDVVPLKNEHEKMIRNTKKAIDVSRVVVVPSEYYKQLLIEKYNIIDKKIVIYPSAGVDEQLFFRFDSDRIAAIKREYKIDNDAFVIGSVPKKLF